MPHDDTPPASKLEAESVIESLRYGIPPREYVRYFTVGREPHLRRLTELLEASNGGPNQGALLVRANYGAGKSHLLEIVREVSLNAGFAISLIVADAQGGVRFNRMDTIFGAVCREIEVPKRNGKGVGQLFDAYREADENALSRQVREQRWKISSLGQWDLSEVLKSPAFYVALRAWVTAAGVERRDVTNLVEDWLGHPQNYASQRTTLYQGLVERLRAHFRDPRPDRRFYMDGVFAFNVLGHKLAWDGLADLDLLAKLSGLRGLVILVDEFEDVIQNLIRRDYKVAAFLNLFRFFRGDAFPGMAYFAVTPDFAAKCKRELLRRGLYDYDYKQFDRLQAFEMEPIDTAQLFELGKRIREFHGVAYGWDPTSKVSDQVLLEECRRLGASSLPDKVRKAIVGIVTLLDRCLQE